MTNLETKNPAIKLGFLVLLKYLVYSWIELETFCLEPSGSSMQPAKPTIINAIAKSDNTFFIRISSKGVQLFLIIFAPIFKAHVFYIMTGMMMQY